MPELELRELPPSSAFTSPHIQAFHGARFFMELLEAEIVTVTQRAVELGGDEEALIRASAGDALQRQALSEAVQVFAAMTVEGAINLLGVILLGEAQFVAKLERKSQNEKLTKLLALLGAAATDDGREALASARRLADARNGFVHPKPREGRPRFDDIGRRSDLDGAREAGRDVATFLAAIRKCYPAGAIFFYLF